MTEIMELEYQRMIRLPEVSVQMGEILSLCDPKAHWEDGLEFGLFWRRNLDVLGNL